MKELRYLDIIEILPHRPPFLLVDYAYIDEKSCIGYKNVNIDDFYFKGHFPNNPIMPGVIIIEAMAQTAGLLSSKGKNMYLTTIEKGRFKSQVKPDSILEMHVKMINNKLNYYLFDCIAKVKENICATVSISAVVD